MTSPAFARVGAACSLGAGALLVAWDFSNLVIRSTEPFSAFVGTPGFAFQATVGFLATLLLVIGVPGVFAHAAERLGRAGLAAFLVLMSGLVLRAGVDFSTLFVTPFLADAAPQLLDEPGGGPLMLAFGGAFLLVPLGLVLLGGLAWRRRAFTPRASGVLLAGALVMSPLGWVLPVSPGELLVGVGLVLVALETWRESGTHTPASGTRSARPESI